MRRKDLWPAPALLAWGCAWAGFGGLRIAGAPEGLALAVGVAIGAALGAKARTHWRRAIVAAGFPLSLLASGMADAVPPLAWLLPLSLLALAYPLKAWRDAPPFPTPANALEGLERVVALPPGARVLDAGCGLGHAMHALRRAYPASRIEGVEWSWPLALLARWRCRFAQVRQGDMWKHDWSGCDLVYLFQRPESMPRAVAKAQRELAAGAWLASLEFEAAPLEPHTVLKCRDGRSLWLYRMQAQRA